MSHKKLGPIKKRLKTYDLAELRALLVFIETLLKASGHHVSAGRKARSAGAKHRKKGRHLKAGVHMVRIKGQGMRKVHVLANGRWRFMKG
jgi:hypothetical protein